MHIKESLILCCFALSFFVVTGCGQGVGSENLTDEDVLKGAIDDDYYALFSTGVIEDEEEDNQIVGAMINNYPRICTEDDPVSCWFRRIHRASRNINIHIEGGVANVSVTTQIEGYFMIDVDGDHNFGEKEIKDVATRFAKFERNTSGRRLWKLKEISPVEINLQDEENRTITIKEITAYVNGELRWTVSDPETMFKFLYELPNFSPGEEVLVTTEVENIDSEGERESYVYLHHTTKVHRPGMKHHGSRHLMYDDGTHGDEVAGDGIFTGTYNIGNAVGYHHAAIDVLDKEMFEDETTQNYNSVAWAMPYLVR